MHFQIGRFDAYSSDTDAFDILCQILSFSELKKGKQFKSSSHKIHRFFYELKKEFPDVLSGFFFNSDPEFPFSRQVAEGFLRLQETEFITRPNPSLDHYRIEVNFENMKPDPGVETAHKIQQMAVKFNKEFPSANDPTCNPIN